MKNNERIVIYSLGFILGMVLVSVIFMRRAAFRDKYYDSFQDPIYPATVRRVEALPQDIEQVMLQGRILDFGYLPSDLDRQQRVWLIKFKKSYPHVRVVQSLASGALMYSAADQIKLTLRPGIDVTDLSPMLNALELRLRNFNRKHNIAIIGVLDTEIDAVPRTIEAISKWDSLYQSADPDFIIFRNN